MGSLLGWACVVLAALYALMQMSKLLGVVMFFRRAAKPAPDVWPSVSMIEPITRSENDLAGVLRARMQLDYPARVQHILVCDAGDAASQEVCRAVLAEFPGAQAKTVLTQDAGGLVASKIEKMLAGLAKADGDVLCFVDDDVLLPPETLRTLIRELQAPGVGAVFGLACYTNWTNAPSSLISVFVNSNALLNYIPLTYFTEPFTVTGHCFALSRRVFEAAGGLNGMEGRADDDHEIARRVRTLGLQLVQTRLIYGVDNRLPTFRAYRAQMKRWFVLPRQTMLPELTRREALLMMLVSADIWLLPLVAALALVLRNTVGATALGACILVVYATSIICERLYTQQVTPLRWAWLTAISAIIAPVLMLTAMAGDDVIEWRGQRMRVRRGGRMEPLA